MHDNDRNIRRASGIVGCGTCIFSVLAIVFGGPIVGDTIVSGDGSTRSKVLLGVSFSICAYAICVFGWRLNIPHDVTQYWMRILWSQYWAATFKENWKPEDKPKFFWVHDSLIYISKAFKWILNMVYRCH